MDIIKDTTLINTVKNGIPISWKHRALYSHPKGLEEFGKVSKSKSYPDSDTNIIKLPSIYKGSVDTINVYNPDFVYLSRTG